MWKLWELPKTCVIDGIEHSINTDYRDILEIISILQSNDIEERIKISAVLQIFYVDDIKDIKNIKSAIDTLMLFINCGENTEEKIPQPKQIDWEQDYLFIVSDVNKSANAEIRALPYLHWFTFISYFSGIGEGQLSQLVNIRNKLRKGEKLEKYEREYYYANVDKVKFKEKYTSEEQEEIDELLKLLDG